MHFIMHKHEAMMQKYLEINLKLNNIVCEIKKTSVVNLYSA